MVGQESVGRVGALDWLDKNQLAELTHWIGWTRKLAELTHWIGWTQIGWQESVGTGFGQESVGGVDALDWLDKNQFRVDALDWLDKNELANVGALDWLDKNELADVDALDWLDKSWRCWSTGLVGRAHWLDKNQLAELTHWIGWTRMSWRMLGHWRMANVGALDWLDKSWTHCIG